jgi:hypothetical protein
MESEGSLSYSQKPTNDPYSEADESNLHPPTPFLEDKFLYYRPIYA